MPPNAKDKAALNTAKSAVMAEEPPSDKKACPYMLRLRLGVFFDGTNNNRYRDEKTGHETNVVRLWKVYQEREDDFARRTKLYVIGVGAVESAKEDKTDTRDRDLQATGAERVKRGENAMRDSPGALDL